MWTYFVRVYFVRVLKITQFLIFETVDTEFLKLKTLTLFGFT
jgi:hypothetical protein